HLKSRVGTVPKQHKRFARRFVFWTAVAGVVAIGVLSGTSGDPVGLPQVAFWEALLVGGGCAPSIPPRLDPAFRGRLAPWPAIGSCSSFGGGFSGGGGFGGGGTHAGAR